MELITEATSNRMVDFSPMGLNETDRAWVRQEIALSRKGVSGFLKDWGGLIGIGALVIFLLNQWSGYVEFRTHTLDRLDSIDASLRQIQAATDPHKVINELAGLKPPELAKNLPALRAVARQSPQVVKPGVETVNVIKSGLLQVHETAPEYWRTLADFLTFASSFASSDVPPPGGPIVEMTNVVANGGIKVPDNATVRLSGRIEGLLFTNDRIIFSSKGVLLNNVRFINCIFEVEGDPQQAPPGVRNAERLLLAGDLKNAYISAS